MQLPSATFNGSCSLKSGFTDPRAAFRHCGLPHVLAYHGELYNTQLHGTLTEPRSYTTLTIYFQTHTKQIPKEKPNP